jgi:hypothetical protein
MTTILIRRYINMRRKNIGTNTESILGQLDPHGTSRNTTILRHNHLVLRKMMKQLWWIDNSGTTGSSWDQPENNHLEYACGVLTTLGHLDPYVTSQKTPTNPLNVPTTPEQLDPHGTSRNNHP